MHYVLVDDSISFDGYTSSRRPMGGAERAFASLPGALVKRGHSVTVLNRIQYPTWCEGAKWRPIDDIAGVVDADVLIAMRKPALLGTVRQVKQRILWCTGTVDYLTGAAVKNLFDSLTPALMFVSATQQASYKGSERAAVIAPGVKPAFFEQKQEAEPFPEVGHDIPMPVRGPNYVPPPHAVITTHPQQGLVWLLDIWTKIVHPQVPSARLAVYSAVLSKGIKGEAVPEGIEPILDMVKSAASANVVVVEPRSDKGMAEIYRSSRLHMYPSFSQDLACWTLRDSQAAGCPAVARTSGGAEEVISNGETGFLVPDAEAFGNVAVQVLTHDGTYKNLSETAGAETRRRTWEAAAADVDEFVASLMGTTAAA
ncbi:MAG: glycosyltransferase [Rhodobacteraceae bacterium]|nr:glycosyltransferase [Paracoccaceae bacterium]